MQTFGTEMRPASKIAHYEQAGIEAGDRAGEDFRRQCSLLSTTDPEIYMAALERAIEDAVDKMRATGATDEQIMAWRRANRVAFQHHLDAWLKERGAKDSPLGSDK